MLPKFSTSQVFDQRVPFCIVSDATLVSTANARPATNISILTTTQSAIAADLDAFDKVTWLTSSYLIAMSSLAPLMGRLSQVFSPRLCMFISTVIIAAGTLIVATSKTFEMFIVGRVISGAGASGIFIIASIIVIQMTSPERRGLFIGLVNTGMTAGVSLGAVIAGALESKIGWVSRVSRHRNTRLTSPETTFWCSISTLSPRRTRTPSCNSSQLHFAGQQVHAVHRQAETCAD